MQPSRLATRLAAVVLFSLVSGLAHAAAPARQGWSPEKLAADIEAKAEQSSFSGLEAFGRSAMRRAGRDRLDRLHHVTWVFLNQSEFDKAAAWNAALKRQALADGDARYLSVAETNALRAAYDQGAADAEAKIAAIAAREPDWFARMHAMRTSAYILIRKGATGAALKLLSEADSLAPKGDAFRGAARAAVWEIEGLALMDLQDLEGSALAFGRAQFEFAPKDYPRPDFDNIYNLASLAATLGKLPLADRLYRAHHRLSLRSELPSLMAWDRNLCATVAEARDAPRDVLACYEGLGDKLGQSGFLSTKALSASAMAHARLGEPALARRRLKELEALKASRQYDGAFDNLPLVRAEVLRAEGKNAAAFEQLRYHWRQKSVQEAARYSAGARQLTAEMEKQLGVRQEQLAAVRRSQALQQDVIRTQRMVVFIGALLGACILALLLWQWRVAGQLRLARRNAEAANRAKSEFLANMSHEIRTPLNGVVAVADLLARSDLKAEEREMVDIIRNSGDTLQRLLSDILDLSRVESGHLTLEDAPFHAGEMVRSVAALSALRCDEKGVKLTVEIDPDLDAAVLGDLVRVRQILTNLLSNAVKFTDKGRINLTAERVGDDEARFTVVDTGVGFDPANKGQVLGRFQQADSSITRRFGGTGLGLAISRQLAELMGGHLDCESEPGAGSRFWFQIPLPASEAQSSTSEAADPEEAETSSGVIGRLRVLVADDHPTNRKVVELMLGAVADLHTVENGQEALDALGAETFDVVLMDMQMPVMDGLTAVRELRAREAREQRAATPVIMLTANALPEHVAEAVNAGADRHLAKPFTAEGLFEAISAVAGQAGDGDEAIAA